MGNEFLDEARRLLGQPRFTVRPLRDDLVELHGWPTASDATLAFLTPILGPSATLILHRLGGYASEGDSVWTPHEFAATFGLGHDDHTALAARSLARLVSFSMARIDSTGIAVRTHVGPLPERWQSEPREGRGHGRFESVYAVLEVKQTLDLTAFTAASEKAQAVRSLTATSAPITHLTGKADVKQPITPLAGLLTQHCGWNPPFGDPLVDAMRKAGAAGQLDIGCALEGGTWVIPTDGDYESSVVVGAEHSLVFLSMQLFNLLQALGTVPRMAVPTWLEAGGVTASRLAPPDR